MNAPTNPGSLLAMIALLTSGALAQPPQPACFAHWPAQAAPAEVGRRVAENILARKFEFEVVEKRKVVIYPEICAWYGALNVAKLSGDTNLQQRLVRRLDQFLTPEGDRRISRQAHVDYRVAGAVPLEIYLQTEDEKALALVAELDPADNVQNICAPTNRTFQEVGADLDRQLQFYLARARKAGDLHGHAPILWTAAALLR